MADSPIGSLPAVQNLANGQPDIQTTDLFVLEQNNAAKKLTGEQITKFVDRNVMSYEGRIVASDAAGGATYNSSTQKLTLTLPHGPGIKEVVAPSNPGQPGATDTYTLIGEDVRTTNGLTPGGTLGTFSVYNGRNGEGLVNSVMGVSPPSGSTDIVKATLMNLIYPLGSIYMTEDATFDPNTEFGGTWAQIEDRVLLAASDVTASNKKYSVGNEGGYETQTVDFENGYAYVGFSDQYASHIYLSRKNIDADPDHYFTGQTFYAANYAPAAWGAPPTSQNDVDAAALGGTQEIDNMPPYHVVCVWKRTALAT